MKRYILFTPQDFDYSDNPSDTVLWQVKLKVYENILDLPDVSSSMLKTPENLALPLCKWQEDFENIGLELIYDYPFAKEYAVLDEEKKSTPHSYSFCIRYKQIQQ